MLPDADQALTRHREYGANAFHVAERSVGIAGSGFVLAAVTCLAMMALMMRMMAGGGQK